MNQMKIKAHNEQLQQLCFCLEGAFFFFLSLFPRVSLEALSHIILLEDSSLNHYQAENAEKWKKPD